VKNLAPETIRLMQAAADARDSLRRLAAAGDDLVAALQVANTQADLCGSPLKEEDSNEQRHSVMIPEARPLWAVNR
jgi:hypothetical protein